MDGASLSLEETMVHNIGDLRSEKVCKVLLQ